MTGIKYRIVFLSVFALLIFIFLWMFIPLYGDDPAQIVWSLSASSNPPDKALTSHLVSDSKYGKILHFSKKEAALSNVIAIPLDANFLSGRKIMFKANLMAKNISTPIQDWNGIKLMLRLEYDYGIEWPQIDVSTGSFAWKEITGRFQIAPSVRSVFLILGLEEVSGEVNMADILLTLAPESTPLPDVPIDRAIFTGHAPGGLRGAMISPATITRDDFDVLTKEWKANLVRWQLIRPAGSKQDFKSYDAWLDQELEKLDTGLSWAKENGTSVIVDLHSPPGGEDSKGGYQSGSGDIFSKKKAQNHFIKCWEKMATRYKGHTEIWGFDLMNEPYDTNTSANCLDWQDLALAAGKAIRAIDPERILIIECANVGGPSGFRFFKPLPLERIVYSVHMYEPGTYTHQGVFSPSDPVVYPGLIDGKYWDRNRLVEILKPVIEFSVKYRVQIYVGEFSAIRWAPGNEKYLSDLISIFEENGWDWTFHAFREWDGWSIEHTAIADDRTKASTMTPRLQLFLQAFQKNVSSKLF